jgi:hypothetical protein
MTLPGVLAVPALAFSSDGGTHAMRGRGPKQDWLGSRSHPDNHRRRTAVVVMPFLHRRSAMWDC